MFLMIFWNNFVFVPSWFAYMYIEKAISEIVQYQDENTTKTKYDQYIWHQLFETNFND